MSRFNHLMQEDIQINRLTGTSSTGSKTYAPARGAGHETIKGRLVWQRQKVITNEGEEALSEAVVFTPGRMSPGDLVIVDGREWAVKAVREHKGLFDGSDHWEVRL